MIWLGTCMSELFNNNSSHVFFSIYKHNIYTKEIIYISLLLFINIQVQ